MVHERHRVSPSTRQGRAWGNIGGAVGMAEQSCRLPLERLDRSTNVGLYFDLIERERLDLVGMVQW